MTTRCWAIGRLRQVAGRRGFTLLELLVVILLLGVVTALVAPRIVTTNGAALQTSARSTAALLRYLGERANGSKDVYRLHFDLAGNGIRVARRLPGGEETAPEDPMLRRRVLEDGVRISDVQTPRLGKVTEGKLLVDVGPAGLGELLVIHLAAGRDESCTVIAYPNNGKVKILAGYQDGEQ